MPLNDGFETSGALSVTAAEAREHQSSLLAKRTTDIPNDLQIRIEYDANDMELYLAYGARGLSTSDTGWLIRKNTYNANNYMELSQTAFNSWDNRASATYA